MQCIKVAPIWWTVGGPVSGVALLGSGPREPSQGLSVGAHNRPVIGAWIKQHPFCKSGFSEVGHLASMVR